MLHLQFAVMAATSGLPTMEDVAELADVSRALVSLVMRGSPHVGDERRLRVLAAAEELGYRPNAFARGLASHRTGSLAVLLNDLHNPFFAEIFDGIADAAVDYSYQLLLGTSSKRVFEADVVESFLQHRPDGLILVGPQLPSRAITKLSQSIPTVVIGRTVPGVDSVTMDENRASSLAVEHLVALGHTDIVHIDGGPGAGATQRRSGFRAAMKRFGLEPRVVGGDFTEQAGVDAARTLLGGRRPTAIFAANDLCAVGTMAVLGSAGLSIPGDVSLVGCDNTFIAGLHHLALTTIDQPRHQMGQTAAALLAGRIAGEHTDSSHEWSTPTLIVRSTTAMLTRPAAD